MSFSNSSVESDISELSAVRSEQLSIFWQETNGFTPRQIREQICPYIYTQVTTKLLTKDM
jgi:hypothetical protein